MSWNKPVEQPKAAPRKSPSALRGAVAGLIVVALGAACFFLFSGGDAKPKAKGEKKPTAIKEVAPVAKTPKAAPETNAVSNASSQKAKVLGRAPTGEEYVAKTCETNSGGVVTDHLVLVNGKRLDVVHLQTQESLALQSDFDLMLAMIGTTPLDKPLPPMPPMGDLGKAFEKAIQNPIVIRETDSDQVKEMKQAALDARQQIADLLAEGYTIEQILSEHNSLREKNIEFRGSFQRELNEVYRTEGKEAAEKYMSSANEKLEKQGIIPLVMPGTGSSKRSKLK